MAALIRDRNAVLNQDRIAVSNQDRISTTWGSGTTASRARNHAEQGWGPEGLRGVGVEGGGAASGHGKAAEKTHTFARISSSGGWSRTRSRP